MDKDLEYNLKLNGEYFYIGVEDNWVLMRNKHFIYDVMSSEKNTKEELEQFVKEHKMYKHGFAVGMKDMILCLLITIESIINMKYHDNELRYLFFGMLIVILTNNLIRIFVDSHNNKVLNKIFEEDKKYLEEKIKGEEKHEPKKRTTKSR